MLYVMLSLLGLLALNFSPRSWSSSVTSWQGSSPCACWAARPRPAPVPLRWSRTCAPLRAGAPS
eukprot:4275935-Pyramimonas_sp.AAC.1